jgi:hypothetical protein
MEYFEKLFFNKLENIEEMDEFLDIHNLPKLNQEEKFKSLNRSIISNNKKSLKKTTGQDGFIAELYHTFRDEQQCSPS